MLDTLRARLGRQVDGRSLAALRMACGLILLYECLWFLGWTPTAPRDPNRIEWMYTGSEVHWNIPYPGLEWLRPLPEPWMSAVVLVVGLASLGVIAGTLYRVSAVCAAVGFTYIHFLEAAVYLNHFYLLCLLTWLLAFLPAHHRWAWKPLGRREPVTTVPFWAIALARGQLVLVYFFAGLAKCNADWLAGEPLRQWLRDPAIARQLEILQSPELLAAVREFAGLESTVYVMAYGGLVFDLAVGPLLLWRRTRLAAFVTTILFHAVNACLFPIGAFPITAALATTVFLAPHWPDAVRLRRVRPAPKPDLVHSHVDSGTAPRASGFALALMAAWMFVQVVVPLRHLAIPGNVHWTEEGHRFSWHMMLRAKTPGPLAIYVVDSSSATTEDVVRPAGPFVYRHVPADRVDWRSQDPLVITHEPLLGERIFINTAGSPSWQSVVGGVQQEWQRRYGRDPELHRTYPLTRLLDLLQEDMRRAAAQGDAEAEQASRAVGIAIEAGRRASQWDPGEPEARIARFTMIQALRQAASLPGWEKRILGVLAQSTPLALQGSTEASSPFLLVTDRTLLQRGGTVAWAIDRDAWRGSAEVLLDTRSLSPHQLESLPQVMRLPDAGGQRRYLWNHARDLHPLQVTAVGSSPLLQQQYARRVADWWSRRYGTRPAVHVSSFARLNHRPMQRMVDERIDLASQQRHWLRHHPWIHPLESEQPSAGVPRSPPRARIAGQKSRY